MLKPFANSQGRCWCASSASSGDSYWECSAIAVARAPPPPFAVQRAPAASSGQAASGRECPRQPESRIRDGTPDEGEIRYATPKEMGIFGLPFVAIAILEAIVWQAPQVLAGAVWGVIGLLNGGDIVIGHNAVQIENDKAQPAGNSATTFGPIITYRGTPDRQEGLHTVGEHEEQHTVQSLMLGPLYFPAVLASWVGTLFLGGGSHGPNSFIETGPQQDPPRPWP